MSLQKKKRLFFVMLVLFNVLTVVSQGQRNDNFKKNRIYRLLNFANKLAVVNPDSALHFFIKAETESVKTGNRYLITKSYYEHAVVLFRSGKNEPALNLFRKSLKLAAQIKSDYYINYSKIYIGTIYLYFSNFKLATKYNLDCLKYFEEKKKYKAISGIYLNLSFIKFEQKDFETMKKYIDSSLKYSVLAKDKVYEYKSLLNLSEYFFHKEEYKKSFLILKKLKIQTAELKKKGMYTNDLISVVFLDLAHTCMKLNMPDSAKMYLSEIFDKYTYPMFTAEAYLTYSDLNISENNFSKALFNAKRSIKICEENNLARTKSTAFKKTADIYALKKNYLKAYEYRTLSSDIKDSIFSSDNLRIQNELEIIYQNSEKQKKIIQLSKEKKISELKNQQFRLSVIILIIVLISSIIFALLMLKQSRIKSKQEAVELEQKLLRTQMNPHFIFNSISAIQDYILNNNPIEASNYLSDFAMLMRAILTSSSHSLIPLEKEIEVVGNYLKLQQMRLSDKFEYKINISEDVDIEEIEVPPMLSQPFIENAIIHGIMNKKNGKGLISVSYFLNQNNLITEIEDNGIGRQNAENIKNPNHKSKAVAITEQRIKLIADKYKKNINFEIIDLKNSENLPSGTLVRFSFPI